MGSRSDGWRVAMKKSHLGRGNNGDDSMTNNRNPRELSRMMVSSVDENRRRQAQAILGASDGTMQFTTLQSPENQEQEEEEEPPHEPHAVLVETKSARVDNNNQEDEKETITTFWNLHEEVEKLKEAKDVQLRDGKRPANDQDGDAESEEHYEIHYGEDTGSSLGIFILPSDEDHSSSVTVDELRDGGEEDVKNTPSSPYHIFHGKKSDENKATGNYGSYSGGSSSSSSPQGGRGSSSSSSAIGGESKLNPEESFLRDILNNVKELGSSVNLAIHQKTSTEKDGVNDPKRAPGNFAFYNPDAPPAGGNPGPGTGSSNGGEGIAPPRGNDGPTSQPTFFGKRHCKATNGSFGDNRQERSGGGVTLNFRYELSTDSTPGSEYERASLYNEILPALEDATTTAMLPAFFSDECMQISTSGSFNRRFLRGGGAGDGVDQGEEDDPTVGYQHQHRRLNRVIGIDSDPMDFPNGDACFGGYRHPTKRPKCYVMEGAITVYFPENFDYKNLVTGTQLTALNTIKEGMDFGTISKLAHPAILDLTFLESSYSMRPLVPGVDNSPKQVVPAPSNSVRARSGGNNVGLIVGVIIVLIFFVIFAGCFFRYRLKQEQAKLDAMMREMSTKKKKKKKKKGSDIDGDDDDSYQSSDGTPTDHTSMYILNRYANEQMDDADDENNLTDREKEIHQRLKKRRKTKKELRRASYASNLSSNHDGSFTTLDTNDTDSTSDLMGYYSNMAASGTTGSGSKTTTSSESTTDVSGSESSTTSRSQTFHTTSTGTSEDTTSDSGSGTTSSGGTTSDSDDDSEEDDSFNMDDNRFNVGNTGTNFRNGAMRTQERKKKGQQSNLIMTGDDDDGSVGTEATGATEAVSNVGRLGNRGGGFSGGGLYGGGFSGGASAAHSDDFSAATEAMGNLGKGRNNPYGGASEWGGGGFSGGASAAPSVDFSAATEAMGNLGGGRNLRGSGFSSGGGFSGGVSAAPSVDFSAATEAMGNLGSRNLRGSGFSSGGGFSGGVSAAPSVDFSAATEAMGNLGGNRNNRGGGLYGGGFAGGASAAPSVDFSAATEAMGNLGSRNLRGSGFSGGVSAGPGASVAMSAATEAMGNLASSRPRGGAGSAGSGASVAMSAATEAMGNLASSRPRGGAGSAGPGASVAMSAATEAIKNTGRNKKPQQMESIGELTFSDF